jgi:hypothetical protein
MLLVDGDKSLEVRLSTGAPASVQADWVATWGKDVKGGPVGELSLHTASGATNSGTGVTMVSAPDTGVDNYHQIIEVNVHNTDSRAVTAQVRINDNGTFYVLKTQALAVGETLHYSLENGWTLL